MELVSYSELHLFFHYSVLRPSHSCYYLYMWILYCYILEEEDESSLQVITLSSMKKYISWLYAQMSIYLNQSLYVFDFNYNIISLGIFSRFWCNNFIWVSIQLWCGIFEKFTSQFIQFYLEYSWFDNFATYIQLSFSWMFLFSNSVICDISSDEVVAILTWCRLLMNRDFQIYY